MSKEDFGIIFCLICFLTAVFFAGSTFDILGHDKKTIKKMELRAIEAKVGEYFLDETHTKRFRYINDIQ